MQELTGEFGSIFIVDFSRSSRALGRDTRFEMTRFAEIWECIQLDFCKGWAFLGMINGLKSVQLGSGKRKVCCLTERMDFCP